MASKKAGRLAGLAALAGLAYMANEKGKGAKDTAAENNRIADARAAREEEKGPASKPSDEAKKEDAGDTGDFMSRRLNRVDTEDGKAYSTNNLSPMSSPAKAASKPPAVRFETVGRTQQDLDSSGRTLIDKQNREAQQAKDMSLYKPRRPDVKLRDTEFSESYMPGKGTSSYTNKTLKKFGAEERAESDASKYGLKKGGKVKKMASGGMTSSASKRADGIATKGKTRGRMC